MDFNLKKENRKKFQDKTKLKRHHKKNYAKVVKADTVNANLEEYESDDTEELEYDQEGNLIPSPPTDEEDQEPQLDENGNAIIPRPRRKKKLQSNAWRYKEELNDELDELDEMEMDALMKSIDFAKISLNKEIDLGGKNKKIDIKNMSTRELSNIKIIDKNDVKPRISTTVKVPNRIFGTNKDPLDELLDLPTKKINTTQLKSETEYVNSTPMNLKSAESFLDELL